MEELGLLRLPVDPPAGPLREGFVVPFLASNARRLGLGHFSSLPSTLGEGGLSVEWKTPPVRGSDVLIATLCLKAGKRWGGTRWGPQNGMRPPPSLMGAQVRTDCGHFTFVFPTSLVTSPPPPCCFLLIVRPLVWYMYARTQ